MKSHYELLFIISINCLEKNVPSLIEAVSGIIKKHGGALVLEGETSKRKLAYPMKQNRHGYYVSGEFDLDKDKQAKLKAELSAMPEIVRFQIIAKRAGAYEPKNISSRAEPETAESEKTRQMITESLKETVEEQIEPKPKTEKIKISLDDLDKKLDKILEEEL